MPRGLTTSNGFIASIHDANSPVNTKFSGNLGTKQFKNWFGNSVIKDNGVPRIVYHGTDANFRVFRKGDIGYHVGTKEQAENRNSKRIMELYAKIEKPLNVVSDIGDWTGANLAAWLYYNEFFDARDDFETVQKKLYDIAQIEDIEAGTPYAVFLESKGYNIVYDKAYDYDEMKKALSIDGGSAGVAAPHIDSSASDDSISQPNSEIKKSDALMNTGASGNIFDLVENSKYDGSKPDIKGHNNTDYFDYFVKKVQIDGAVFNLQADVKKQYGVFSGYTYDLKLIEDKTTEASPAREGQNASLNQPDNASVVTNTVPQERQWCQQETF